MGLGRQGHTPGVLHPGKRPGTHSTRGWVDPRAGEDGCGKSRLHWDSITGLHISYQVVIATELSRPAYRHEFMKPVKAILCCNSGCKHRALLHSSF